MKKFLKIELLLGLTIMLGFVSIATVQAAAEKESQVTKVEEKVNSEEKISQNVSQKIEAEKNKIISERELAEKLNQEKIASEKKAAEEAAKKAAEEAQIKTTTQTTTSSVVPTISNADVWDQLAACESGGNWAANTGNGFYGGIQFMESTWALAGGTKYAPRPDLATREQQIDIAQSWLAKTSWSQWPACSSKLGLR